MESEKPAISIVSGSYNRCKFLKETVKSIRNNGITVPYEIIIIDGGSKDGSIEYLTKQQDIVTIVQHNRIKVDGRQVRKHTWGYFMNLAFQMAKGKYILMISDDCLLLPNAVMNGYNLFEKELSDGKNIGAVAFYYRDFPQIEKYYVNFTLNDTINVNHGMYLRDALADINWIDENSYNFYHADCDLCMRLRQKGYDVIDSPDSYVEHSMHFNRKMRQVNEIESDPDLVQYLKKWRPFPNKENKMEIDSGCVREKPDSAKTRRITLRIDDIDVFGVIEKEYNDPTKTYRTILLLSPRSLILYIGKKIAPQVNEAYLRNEIAPKIPFAFLRNKIINFIINNFG